MANIVSTIVKAITQLFKKPVATSVSVSVPDEPDNNEQLNVEETEQQSSSTSQPEPSISSDILTDEDKEAVVEDKRAEVEETVKGSVIRIVRKWVYWAGNNADSSTVGTFSIDNDSLTGYILEPYGESTAQSGQDKRIPLGTYNLVWHVSDKYTKAKYPPNGVPKLYNNSVSQSRAILIHPGNTGTDSIGCLLPGSGITVKTINNKKYVTAVTSSTVKLEALIKYINKQGIGNVKIIITEAYEDYK